MSAKLKISFLVLAGMAMTLSACNDIRDDRSEPTVTAATRSSNQGKTSSVSHSPAAQPRQTLRQNNLAAKTTTASAQAHRENYKPISLAHIAGADALIGNDPKAIALSAFANTESEGGSREVTVDYPQPNQAIVTITQTGVADDSVGGIRYRVDFLATQPAQIGKQWKLVWAGSQVKCHPGRGHQDWSTELCL
jgi:hypothetical protein